LENNRHYLFTTYYQPKSQERKGEYDFCIEKNKSAFDRVYLFVEEQDVEAASKFGVEVVVTTKRPTFKDFFDYFIGAEEFEDSINIVANTDIFFLNMQQIDNNLHRLQKGKSCFALTRYDYHHNRPSHLFETPDSQDTWVFNGHERLELVQNINFSMGVAGCDNRLAHELKAAGFDVLNPSKSIYTFHLHDVPIRTFVESVTQRIPPPYLLLHPTE
jgi:hypothetical protein